MRTSLSVVWIHDTPSRVGGAETYVRQSAALLRDSGVRTTLLYDVSDPAPHTLGRCFDASFPIVDLEKQLRAIRPDVLYAHRTSEANHEAVVRTGIPAYRFLHDHDLLCLREHKYSPWDLEPCTKTVGSHCYRCPGMFRRVSGGMGVRLATLSTMRGRWATAARYRGLVVASTYMRDHVIAHGFDPERVHKVPMFGPAPSSARESARESELVRSSCVVVPSRQPETFALVGLEAMAHAVPCVATAVGGVREWLREGKTGLLVPPNDPVAMATAIDRLVSDTDLSDAMARESREHYLAHFATERHRQDLLSLFSPLPSQSERSVA